MLLRVDSHSKKAIPITYLLGTAAVDIVLAVSVVFYFIVVVIINVEKVSCFFKESCRKAHLLRSLITCFYSSHHIAYIIDDVFNLLGSQINMMQEQEIVRLEMKLKGDELERLNLSKQLDYQRKTIIEKDRIRIKQQDEIYSLTEKMSTFQDSLSFYKTENETNIDKLSRYEKELESLRKDVISLSCELETQKAALSKARLEKTQMEGMNKRLQDNLEASNVELAEQKDSLQLLNLR